MLMIATAADSWLQDAAAMALRAWPLVLVIGEFTLKAGMICVILLRPRTRPPVTLAWIVVILVIPLAGTIAYLLVGDVRLGKRRRERHARIVQQLDDRMASRGVEPDAGRAVVAEQYRPITALADAIAGTVPRGGNRVDLIGQTNEFIDALVSDIEAATSHCHLLFYIFETDESAQRVAEALIEAAGRQVACRLLVDAVGSRRFSGSALRRRMSDAGVEVVEALPANAIRLLLARIDLRNHRKLAVIDGVTGYVGSHNITDPAFAPKRRFGPWVDAICRIRGPVVRDLQRLFLEDWSQDTGQTPLQTIEDQPPPHADGVTAQLLASGPNANNEALRQLLQAAFHTAREELILTTPYFVPDEATALALRGAARRGVEVHLVVPARSDSRLVNAASRSHYEDLLRAGVRIHEFENGLLHAKTITLDRDLALIGSANLDRRSFELNFEVNLLVPDSDVASQLRFLQQAYISQSRPVSLGRWERRIWPRRMWHNAAGVLSPLL